MEKRGGQAHREDKTSADEKTGWPEANGIFRGVLSSCPWRRARSVTGEKRGAPGSSVDGPERDRPGNEKAAP